VPKGSLAWMVLLLILLLKVHLSEMVVSVLQYHLDWMLLLLATVLLV